LLCVLINSLIESSRGRIRCATIATTWRVAAICLAGLIGPAICQTSAPPVQPNLREQIRIGSFQSSKRSDNYGIASFVISNVSDKALNPIELTCWL
jgi:hypothetical protein